MPASIQQQEPRERIKKPQLAVRTPCFIPSHNFAFEPLSLSLSERETLTDDDEGTATTLFSDRELFLFVNYGI